MKYYFYDEKVKNGIYRCVLCGVELHMNEDEVLDLCPVCSASKYEKIEN